MTIDPTYDVTRPFPPFSVEELRRLAVWFAENQVQPNPTGGLASTSEMWRSARQGTLIEASYVQRNWLDLTKMAGLFAESFSAMNPPVFVVEGDPGRYVPERDYERFCGRVAYERSEFYRDATEASIQARAVAAREKKKRLRAGRVYLIEAVGCGRVKIGWTSDTTPRKRLKSLQTASSYKLRTVAHVAGAMAVERDLHKRFAAHRILPSTEWFHDVPEIREHFEEARRR